MKKTPARKRKAAPRKAKKPAKRKTIVSVLETKMIDRHSDGAYLLQFGWLSWKSNILGLFDLAGMEPGDVRKFKITTEVIE